MAFKPSEFREEAEQDDKEDVGEVKSDKLNKIIKKLCSLWILILGESEFI